MSMSISAVSVPCLEFSVSSAHQSFGVRSQSSLYFYVCIYVCIFIFTSSLCVLVCVYSFKCMFGEMGCLVSGKMRER